ncbi:hypothetical protein CAPTEDRAFT_222382 [Capitella teleta]|uniref:Uncharacterized protein n=1 Tax=Capitella teleta TaxID=283909 RepID=R7T4L7_CAPTE|nr:hypothetical protein CAPTEDRAFT_222382 [Capitella teleta]|eukprot:ELT87883.1 hypothetical protein CAPTEDRAFT_222382 [Capitella teleta]
MDHVNDLHQSNQFLLLRDDALLPENTQIRWGKVVKQQGGLYVDQDDAGWCASREQRCILLLCLGKPLTVYQNLGETRKGLTALKRVVSDLDGDILQKQKRTCQVGGGMNRHCTAALLNSKMEMANWLNSGMSPGKKRSLEEVPRTVSKRKRLSPCDVSGGNAGYSCYLDGLATVSKNRDWLDTNPLAPGKRSSSTHDRSRNQSNSVHSSDFHDLARKRKGLDILRRILSEMEADLIYEQKRTCQFNLGGHCATESAASVADHWHYLNSPLSPGRKRRDTGLYKAVVSGRIFKDSKH